MLMTPILPISLSFIGRAALVLGVLIVINSYLLEVEDYHEFASHVVLQA
jgi:hypothetical protein